MKRERGQALILVLVLLVVGALVTVPVVQLVNTNLTARMMYGEFIKEDYAADAATDYALWKLRWDPTFASSLEFGIPSEKLYVTINGVTADSVVTAEATEIMSGLALIDHQIMPTKEVTPTTALPDVLTTFTYTIILERLEPDDELFDPLESIKDAMDAGFVYLPNSSALDGVPFDDDDLTILEQPVIVENPSVSSWSNIADEDSMVRQDAPTQNYGTSLTMDVSSGLPASSVTDRSFLKFDISSIPTGPNIVLQSATLQLWAESYPAAMRTYDLHLMTEDWTNGSINWNNQPAVAPDVSASIPTPGESCDPMEWNVISDVLDWVDGATTNYGWRISDRDEGLGTESYTSTVNDTLEFDTSKGKEPNIIPISGDIYAIAYAGDDDDGFLTTVEIDGNGAITDTVIDTLEFDTVKGKYPDIIHVLGDVYAIAYTGDGDDGFLTTVEIDGNGAITDTVIDTLEFDTLKGYDPEIVQINADTYAIAYVGDGNVGFLTTVEIDGNGAITDTVIDSLEFDTYAGGWSLDLIPISGDVYAIAYTGPGDNGFLKTVKIQSNGNIPNVMDTLEFDTSTCWDPDITPISGDVYAIAHEGPGGGGFLKTVEIGANGQITNTVIDSLEFDTLGYYPDIIPVSGDVYVIAYTGSGDDGFLTTVVITADGSIIKILTNTPEFDTKKGMIPKIIPISGDIYAIAYAGDGDDGFLKTVDLVPGSNIEHITVFHTKDDGDPGGEEPVLLVEYIDLEGAEPFSQTIEWLFNPDLYFTYGQDRTLSFQAKAILPDDSRFWNAARILPNFAYTGLVAPITVGNPPDTGIPGSGATITKTADPEIIYAGIPTLVTYVISITNSDIGDFNKLDYIEDYLPPGFSYVLGSASAEWSEWPEHPEWPPPNSTDNPAYQTYSQYYNIGDFEPDFKDDPSGRLILKWHAKPSANGLSFPPLDDNKLLHDRPFPAGVTYTQTFQALAEVEMSGSYPNEVFVKLKDWGLYGDRGLGDLKEIYSWPTGEVVVPAYDILTGTEHSILRAHAAITVSGIEVRSWHWKKHK